MAGKQELLERVSEAFGVLVHSPRFRNNAGQFADELLAERFYAGLLNLVLQTTYPGVCLRPVTGKNKNYPSIDLADSKVRVAVQLTSNGSWSKVNDTLDTFQNQGLYKSYDRLIILVTGKKPEFRITSRQKGDFYFECERDIWDRDLLFQRIADLDAAVLQEVEAYLGKELNRIPPVQRGLNLPFSAVAVSSFVGRQKELVELAKRVTYSDSREPVFVAGPSGMGKTALVATFCDDYADGNVYYVRFYESFFRTIAERAAAGIEGSKSRKPDRQRDYNAVLERLKQCSSKDILVIDDVDEPNGDFRNLQQDPAWSALCELPLRLILITRCAVDEAMEIGTMEKDALRAIFDSSGQILEDSEKDALIEIAHGHTQTLDLIARILKDNEGLTPENLLACGRRGALDEKQISASLRILLQKTVRPEQDDQLLRWATLFPHGGIAADYLMPALEMETVEKQVRNGWLQYDTNSDKLMMDPLVRQACVDELKPDDENCGAFLQAVWGQYSRREYDAVKYCQLAELFSEAAEILPDTKGDWAARAGVLWNQVGRPDDALHYENRAVEKLRQSEPGSRQLALALNNLGQTYGVLGDRRRAEEKLTESLEIQETVLQETDPILAATYNNLGQLYCADGNYEHAMNYQRKALAWRKKNLPPGHPSLAQSYNNLGTVYGYLGQYKDALLLYQKALDIRANSLPSSHPDLARSYEAIGSAYVGMKEYAEALGYLRKAEYIMAGAMPAEHPQLSLLRERIRQLDAWLMDHARDGDVPEEP